MIKYIGSKRRLLPEIRALVGSLDGVRTVLDLFSGTARVGHALKRDGYHVRANDHNAYAHCLARCYVAADRSRVAKDAERLLAELRRAPAKDGWFTETYCREARFFRPENGARVEGIREAIAARGLEPELEAVALVSLMEAADRVDSTTGVQMAYLKSWAPRAFKELELRMPALLDGPGEAHALDALDAAGELEADLAYLDPPYNQHSYISNYHVWETLVRWDEPEVYGVARKRVDCRERKSAFNSKRQIRDALADVLRRIRARYVVVSFNDEGYLSPGEVRGLLGTRGEVRCLSYASRRYVGAQIGVFNPAGQRVGSPRHLENREMLFVSALPPLQAP